MSDDELEKLAAEMQNIKPSEASRESGLNAAMAAFDAEFAAEAVSETTTENLASTQGTASEARPTGQTTGIGPAATFGRDAMSKLKDIFSFSPKAAMMMGSCAAALFATSLYFPNTTFEDMPSKSAPQAVAADVEPGEDKMAKAKRAEMAEVKPPKDVMPSPITEPAAPIVEPIAPATEPKPMAPAIAETAEPIEAPKTAEAMTPEVSTDATEALPSNVVTIERRDVKTPARTSERAIPAITKTIERRRLKTPARTVERSIPAVTKMETRRVLAEDGTYKTVQEPVVVQEASTELVTIPAEFETYTETVIVQPQTVEYVSTPPVYETVRDTVQINADGSTEVLNSEAVSSDKGGIAAMSDSLAAVDADSASGASSETEKASAKVIREYRAVLEEKDNVALFVAPSSPEPSGEIGRAAVDEGVYLSGSTSALSSAKTSGDDEVVVTASRSTSAEAKTSMPSFAPASPPPPRIERGEVKADKSPVRMVERVIPAVTETHTRRVVKTPASTVERTIPAITKDVTVQVLVEDGTYKEVTKTFVIQPASVEYVSAPITYETVTETVVVSEARTEMVAIGPDGKIIRSEPVVKKPKPKPTPQSGLLTAGDYDDVLNPDLYKIYLDKMLQGQLSGKDLPYVDADQRVNIRVVDSLGKPVPMADITLTTAGHKKMFPLRTGADGMAYLYPSFDGLKPGTRLKISAKGARTVRTKLTRKLLKNGGDLVIDLNIDAQPVERMDLLLTIDATGSMGDEMRYLQSELKAIIGRVEEANPGIDIRTGLVVYRDVGDSYVVREVPFTDDIEDFRKALGQQKAGGGGDTPEAMHTALQTGLAMDWREDALKVNLLVADAPPHDRHITETWEAGLLSRTRGIHVVSLAASGVDKTAEFLMRSMAQITGGRYLFLTDDSGIGNAHAKPTVDCYVVTRLDGLVTRVLSSLIKGERVEPQAGEVIRSVGNYRAGTCEIDPQDQITEPLNVNYEK